MKDTNSQFEGKIRPVKGRSLFGQRVRASIIRDHCDVSLLPATTDEDYLSDFLDDESEEEEDKDLDL